MSEKELRELNAWIYEFVMKRAKVEKVSPRRWDCRYAITDTNPDGVGFGPAFKSEQEARVILVECSPRYTTEPAAALAVLEKCVEKLNADHQAGLSIYATHKGWVVCSDATADRNAETLPLAICLFAKKLFAIK